MLVGPVAAVKIGTGGFEVIESTIELPDAPGIVVVVTTAGDQVVNPKLASADDISLDCRLFSYPVSNGIRARVMKITYRGSLEHGAERVAHNSGGISLGTVAGHVGIEEAGRIQRCHGGLAHAGQQVYRSRCSQGTKSPCYIATHAILVNLNTCITLICALCDRRNEGSGDAEGHERVAGGMPILNLDFVKEVIRRRL